MPYKHFSVPVSHGESAEDELNSFLSRHRIVVIDQQWHTQGDCAMWCYRVEYVNSRADEPPSNGAGGKSSMKGRVDYRELLKPTQFVIYSKLRDLRSAIALSEGCPVYAVFTNAQLASMVTNCVSTRTQLESITGVGDSRKARFADRMLEILAIEFGGVETIPPATQGLDSPSPDSAHETQQSNDVAPGRVAR